MPCGGVSAARRKRLPPPCGGMAGERGSPRRHGSASCSNGEVGGVPLSPTLPRNGPARGRGRGPPPLRPIVTASLAEAELHAPMPDVILIDDPADPRIGAYADIRERDLVGREG